MGPALQLRFSLNLFVTGVGGRGNEVLLGRAIGWDSTVTLGRETKTLTSGSERPASPSTQEAAQATALRKAMQLSLFVLPLEQE